MKHLHRLPLILVLIAVLLTACSPAAPAAPAETSSTQAPANTSARFPTGRFVSTTDKAIAVRYNADGTFEWYFGGKNPIFVGNYSVEGNRITSVNPNETDPLCKDPAAYEWHFDGKVLSFSSIGEDPCKGRREANAGMYMLEEAPGSEIAIDAADFSYSAPETVSAGWVSVTLTNSGQEPHHVQFLRLNDGATAQQFEEALKQGEGPALALVQQVGGVGAIAPGEKAQAVINLPAGDYVLLCLIPSPADGTPHHAKGMLKALTVQPSGESTSLEPTADLTIRLKDFSFEMPGLLRSGTTTFKIINDGPEAHEWNILRLAEGKTAEDVLSFLAAPAGPPPFMPVGGMNGLDSGLAGYAEVNLQPGRYAAICNIPSPVVQGHPHFALGMITEFTVEQATSASFPTGKFVSVSDKGRGYQFNPDGTFGYYLGGSTPVVEGTYSVVGGLLSVRNPTENEPACQGSVTYKWFFDGEKLTFAPVGDDACRARRDSFADTYTAAQ